MRDITSLFSCCCSKQAQGTDSQNEGQDFPIQLLLQQTPPTGHPPPAGAATPSVMNGPIKDSDNKGQKLPFTIVSADLHILCCLWFPHVYRPYLTYGYDTLLLAPSQINLAESTAFERKRKQFDMGASWKRWCELTSPVQLIWSHLRDRT